MGYALSSFRRSLGTLTTHPKLFVGIGGTAVIGSVAGFVVGNIPLVGALLSGVFVTPLVLAAAAAMAHASLRGTPEYGNLIEGIEDHWQPMIGAFGVLFGVYFAAAFALTIVVIVAFFAVGFSGSSGVDGGSAFPALFGGGILLLLASAGVVVLLVGLFVQFLDVAIVVGGAGAFEAFRVCWRIVRAEPISVLGYSLIRFAIAVVPVWIAWLGGFYLAGATVNDAGIGALAVFVVPFLATLLVIPFTWTIDSIYHVAFFDGLDERHAFVSTESVRNSSAD